MLRLVFLAIAVALPAVGEQTDTTGRSIPFDQLGAEAQKQYTGDGIGVIPTKDGAKLKAIMQDLEAEATPDGLWLTSTADEDAGKPNRFRVKAVEMGRVSSDSSCSSFSLAAQGIVRASKAAAVFVRPSLIEQYTVSTDGVRQDFVVTRRPPRNGEALSVELEVTGARAAESTAGMRLTVEATGRELAYSRLKVTDATGKDLPAEMRMMAPDRLRVLVQDDSAVYPVCIDPTFSDADWISVNAGMPGANDTVNAIVIDGNGDLCIGGNFTFIGTVMANRIAKWNGSAWSALAAGMSDAVHTLAVSGSDLYAGGSFTTAGGISVNYVAKWDGSAWSTLGPGMSGPVYALAVSGSNLYAGGSFTTAGGVSANNIAKWNGSAWSALDSGTNGSVYALAASGSNLYVGGSFSNAAGMWSVNCIAKWNGSTWSGLGLGMGGGLFSASVFALAVSGSDLYAGGQFTTAGGVSANCIAKWNGSAWSSLGLGMVGAAPIYTGVHALAVIGSDLYAGGNFTTAGGVSASHIAKWNGSAWSSLGSGMSGPSSLFGFVWVEALAVIDGDVYAGGTFSSAGGAGVSDIAKWNGSAWSALGSGMNGSVYALTASGGELYVGGSFTTVGDVSVNCVAKWNGSAWSALGSGMVGGVFSTSVRAFAVIGNDLYAAGDFKHAGGVSTNYIAKWDGNTWSALGSGVGGAIYAFAVLGGDLYAGGAFTNAGGVSANYIAKWDGNTWSALGSGVGGAVHALAVHGDDLYAGGAFTTAGGVSANYIAKWDGGVWSALGSGMPGPMFSTSVNALAVSGSDLYAGGAFTTAGGVSANYIAKWDGTAWSALGSGMAASSSSASVNALVVSDGDVYAGGLFNTAGGVTANFIAKWNGSAWSALGSGTSGSILAVAVSGCELYAGGTFISAGGKVSPFIARANLAGGIADSDGDGLLDAWEMEHFAFRDAHGAFDDSDHDGYSELMEEAFGLHPLASNASGLPPVVEEGGYLTMTITKQPGVTYEVQSAGTLLPGQPDSFSAGSTTVLINDATTLKVRDNVLMSTPPSRFMRVQVTAAP